MGARGVGGGLGNSEGFLLRGWDVSRSSSVRVFWEKVEQDGRLGYDECRKARQGSICVEVRLGVLVREGQG